MFGKKKAPLFKKKQKVFYPGADLTRAHIIKSTITGIIDDVDGKFYYNTNHSFRIPEDGIKVTQAKAKEELIRRMKIAQKNSKEKFIAAIESIEKATPKELIEMGERIHEQEISDMMGPM